MTLYSKGNKKKRRNENSEHGKQKQKIKRKKGGKPPYDRNFFLNISYLLMCTTVLTLYFAVVVAVAAARLQGSISAPLLEVPSSMLFAFQ